MSRSQSSGSRDLLACLLFIFAQLYLVNSFALTLEDIERKMESLNTDELIDQNSKNKATEFLKKATERLNAAAGSITSSESFVELARSASTQIESFNQKKNEEKDTDKFYEMSPAELDTEISNLDDAILEAERKIVLAESKISRFKLRPEQIDEQLKLASKRLREISDERVPIEQKATDSVSGAQLTYLEAREISRQADIEALSQEKATLSARSAIVVAELEALKGHRESLIAIRAPAQKILSESQLGAANSAKQKAADLRDSNHESAIVKEFDKITSLLAEELSTNLLKNTEERQTFENVSRDLVGLKEEFEAVKKRVDAAAGSSSLGRFLRSRAELLPNVRQFERRIASQESKSAEVSLRQIEVSELLDDIKLAETERDSWLERYGVSNVGEDAVNIEEGLAERREFAQQLEQILGNRLRLFNDLENLYRENISLAAEYQNYLNDQLVWVRSSYQITGKIFTATAEALAWLFSHRNWVDFVKHVVAEVKMHPLSLLILGALVALFIFTSYRFPSILKETNAQITKGRKLDMKATWLALLYTILVAFLLPVIITVVGYRIAHAGQSTEFTSAAGRMLMSAGLFLGFARFAILICRPYGLAINHFKWDQKSVIRGYKLTRSVSWVALPIYAMVTMLETQVAPESGTLLAIILFAICCGVASWYAYLALNQKTGVTVSYLRKNSKGWLSRTRKLWLGAIVFAPVVLGALAFAGYFYLAKLIMWCLITTIITVFSGFVVQALLERWLRLKRRRLQQNLAAERRKTNEQVGMSAEAAPVTAATEETDIETIDTQTRQLLNTFLLLIVLFGCWFIWSGALPALGVLDNITLWQHAVASEGETKFIPITLEDVFLAALIFFIVILAAKNLPAALEIGILQGLPFDGGTRYAIKTLTQYAIVAIGVAVAVGRLGLAWSDIQWLVAAVGVGLGFGLQEIFANFVSGLIILFERPIRIGDTVTVGSMNGTVTRINIRATTLVDWDNKEVLVPNKTFITNDLTNWTLTDAITRVVIPIGIAYGSDTELAHKVILETVSDNEMVLKHPPMQLLFLRLGDSALEFELRVYVNQLSERLQATHAIMMAVERALGEHNITIPFPQRDVHVHWGQGGPPLGITNNTPEPS